jgi:hypothetical protein
VVILTPDIKHPFKLLEQAQNLEKMQKYCRCLNFEQRIEDLVKKADVMKEKYLQKYTIGKSVNHSMLMNTRTTMTREEREKEKKYIHKSYNISRHNSGGVMFVANNMFENALTVAPLFSSLSATAFVTFKSFYDRCTFVNNPITDDPNEWVASEGPLRSEIVWENIYVSKRTTQSRYYIILALLLLWAVLFSVPIFAIQQYIDRIIVSHLNLTDKHKPGTNVKVGPKSLFEKFIGMVLPSLIQLLIFDQLGPILRVVCIRYERYKLRSTVRVHIARRCALM